MTVGVAAGEAIGWGFAAFCGLARIWTYAHAFLPLLIDPARGDIPTVERARLAALLCAAFPARMAFLALVGLALLVLSTFLVVTLLSIAVAYVALVGNRYVLPAPDRLERRAMQRLPA